MPTLRLLSPGTCTLVVDHGRPRSRSLGVPVGGPADRRSFLLGNALLGNPPEAAALEVALSGPTLVADADLALVLVGAPFDLEAPGLSPRVGRTFTLPAGVPLSIRGTRTGVRAYLCVAGGIQAPRVLDSATSLAPLRTGEELTVSRGSTTGRFAELPLRIPGGDEVVSLRVLPGSHADWFASMGGVFTVGAQSNRMGLRLNATSPPIPLSEAERGSQTGLSISKPLSSQERGWGEVASNGVRFPELTSEPVCPGTVQVPRDGQPIVLGVDCQTIGGYPRLAQVIRADLDLLGQLRPGTRVRFQVVSLAEAEALDRAQREDLRRWINRTTAASHPPAGA